MWASQVRRGLLLLTSCAALVSAAQNPATTRTPTAGRGVVAGRVVDTKGAGVPGAEVMIGGPSGWVGSADGTSFSRRVIADEHGDFAFAGLPPGLYAFSASKSGYSGVIYDQPGGFRDPDPMKVADGERRLDLVITITKLSIVTGTVTDETGAPVTGVSVTTLMPMVRGGRWQLVGSRGGVTNDRGAHRITQISNREGTRSRFVSRARWCSPTLTPRGPER